MVRHMVLPQVSCMCRHSSVHYDEIPYEQVDVSNDVDQRQDQAVLKDENIVSEQRMDYANEVEVFLWAWP